jgi:hypothetical protein
MKTTCPKCNQQLPEAETLEFRFCPHCGAEIATELQQPDDAYLTIPPDSPPPQADHRPVDLNPETKKKITVANPLSEQTSEPQPMASRQKPKLTPPAIPPPASFFRTRSNEKTPSIRPAEKVSPKRDQKKQSPTKNRNIVIAILVILAIIILLLGALFTF